MSALEAKGLDAAWDEMTTLATWRRETDVWQRTRTAQSSYWFSQDVHQGLLTMLKDDPRHAARIATAQADVASGKLTPAVAAAQVLAPLQALMEADAD